jgi:hypothetical protein
VAIKVAWRTPPELAGISSIEVLFKLAAARFCGDGYPPSGRNRLPIITRDNPLTTVVLAQARLWMNYIS